MIRYKEIAFTAYPVTDVGRARRFYEGVLGLKPNDIRVMTEVDTSKDAWSIASGNYASRFAPAVAGTAHLAASRLRDRIARIAAQQLNVTADDIVFKDGRIGAAGNSEND